MHRIAALSLSLWLWLVPGFAYAGFLSPPPADEGEARILQSDMFLKAHPDVHHRMRALYRLDAGDTGGAIEDLRVAARHADKPSQALLAEMYWTGRGVATDRALAYIWMDLAAERGYPQLVALRERYWAGLADAERAAALARGGDFYAEYGDAAARPRLEELMARARRGFLQSRAHSVGSRTTNVIVGGRFRGVDGRELVSDRYWTADGYFALQDELWNRTGRGRVDVGALEPVAAD